ncbi:hypothetical protein FOCC_FOCC016127 [Frankliniella occidentalis]|nr:hypothetical protein FOCC_FOCC016127 [Frankliniella occidentalis]
MNYFFRPKFKEQDRPGEDAGDLEIHSTPPKPPEPGNLATRLKLSELPSSSPHHQGLRQPQYADPSFNPPNPPSGSSYNPPSASSYGYNPPSGSGYGYNPPSGSGYGYYTPSGSGYDYNTPSGSGYNYNTPSGSGCNPPSGSHYSFPPPQHCYSSQTPSLLDTATLLEL